MSDLVILIDGGLSVLARQYYASSPELRAILKQLNSGRFRKTDFETEFQTVLNFEAKLLHSVPLQMSCDGIASDKISTCSAWYFADPLKLQVTHNGILCRGRSGTLDSELRADFLAERNELFEDSPLVFEMGYSGRLYVGSCEPLKVNLTPVSNILGKDISTYLPTGDEAIEVNRWLTELQMWLHQKDLNGEHGHYDAFWFWGYPEPAEPVKSASKSMTVITDQSSILKSICTETGDHKLTNFTDWLNESTDITQQDNLLMLSAESYYQMLSEPETVDRFIERLAGIIHQAQANRQKITLLWDTNSSIDLSSMSGFMFWRNLKLQEKLEADSA